jgi:hypothetical protein
VSFDCHFQAVGFSDERTPSSFLFAVSSAFSFSEALFTEYFTDFLDARIVHHFLD